MEEEGAGGSLSFPIVSGAPLSTGGTPRGRPAAPSRRGRPPRCRRAAPRCACRPSAGWRGRTRVPTRRAAAAPGGPAASASPLSGPWRSGAGTTSPATRRGWGRGAHLPHSPCLPPLSLLPSPSHPLAVVGRGPPGGSAPARGMRAGRPAARSLSLSLSSLSLSHSRSQSRSRSRSRSRALLVFLARFPSLLLLLPRPARRRRSSPGRRPPGSATRGGAARATARAPGA